ncbi:MAG: DUF167 domain-containing protein [Candidatus Aminicenantes bacterium]|nr:DUF167 domain-containing protein [Candidatus Aminicenantes bacterium]
MKVHLNVKVQPRSAQPGVERTGERDLRVRVKAAPDKGRANAEVIELLAEHFNVPRSCVTIARGQTSRNKLIVIESDKKIK